MMPCPIRLSGVGMACSRANGGQPADSFANRLSAILSALPRGLSPVRLVHPLEEMALLAACEALTRGGIRLPVGGDTVGMVFGVEEGIDGIKARYYAGILRDGPLGASLITFPLTAPNTVAARISILLDIRGESVTVCGGSLSGAQAIGLAVDTLRQGKCRAVLAGGVTSVEDEFLHAMHRLGQPDSGPVRSGACLLLLEAEVSETSGAIDILGYGEGFGPDAVRNAVQCCLEDAQILPGRIAWIQVVGSGRDAQLLSRTLRRMVVNAPIVQSPESDLYSAAFPMAVADASTQVANGNEEPVLVVGTDCLAGASSVLLCRGAQG